jgi:alpha-tubulin suppressor-like RCC1 family protein
MGNRVVISFVLTILMVSMAQVPGISNIEYNDAIIEEELDEKMQLNPVLLNPQSPYFPNTFVDDVHYFDSVRPVSITVGELHSCLVYDDGTMTCSGRNTDGRLGNDVSTASSNTQHMDVMFPDDVFIVKAEAGYSSTCAIDSEGELWCWGLNSNGEAGINSTANYIYIPHKVDFGMNESIVDVAIGYSSKCAITENSRLFCWGTDSYGVFFSNPGSQRSPLEIDLASHIKPTSITSGFYNMCILNEDGAVYCWGYNNYGQLGDGTSTNRDFMVQALLPYNDPAVLVETGELHTCVLLVSGEMRCWGQNSYAQLGTLTATPTTHHVPVVVQNLPIRPMAIDVGWGYTCALLITQDIKCWGLNNYGMLGDGGTVSGNSNGAHRDVVYSNYGLANPVELSLGRYTTCSIFDEGRVACWGYNGAGLMGDGSESQRNYPYANKITVGQETTTLLFPAGKSLTKAPFVDGMNISVAIYPPLPLGLSLDVDTGAITHNGTGNITTTTHNLTFVADTQQAVVALEIIVRDTLPYEGRVDSYLGGISLNSNPSMSRVSSLSSSYKHGCLSLQSGELLCWGDGDSTKLGTSATTDVTQPVSININSNSVYSVATANSHTCSVMDTGKVYCWGEGEFGRLGLNSETDTPSPSEVIFPNHRNVEMLATQNTHNCALTDDGMVWCWGYNNAGQLGLGDTSNRNLPQEITLPTDRLGNAISVGNSFSCLVLDNGSVSCWGINNLGQLGDGSLTNSTQPGLVNLATIGLNAVTVSSGDSHSCAILVDGQVACWGRNNVGQLGDGSFLDKSNPVITQLPSSKNAVMIEAGISHTCAIMDDGSMYCWGLNANGQLNNGSGSAYSSPVQSQLPTGTSAVIVATGESHTCVLLNDSSLHCIGGNTEGQLGDSTLVSKTSLTPSSWNQNSSVSELSYTLGYASKRSAIVAGWGQMTYSSLQLPSGVSFDIDDGSISYDGLGSLGQFPITISTTNGVDNHSTSIAITIFEHNQVEGRIGSFVYDAGFSSSASSTDAISINAGHENSCLITHENRMKCWGYNAYGQVGVNHASTVSSPSYTYETWMKSAKSMDIGTYHTCSIDNESQLWCWGYNNYGQVGNGDTANKNNPILITAFEGSGWDAKILQVSVGAYLTCALTSNWEVFCWGANNYNQLGVSNSIIGTSQKTPMHIEGLGSSRPVMVSAGEQLACILLENGSIGCMGYAANGAMGDDNTTESIGIRWPQLPAGRTAVSIDVGIYHACAILDDFSLVCWGQNNNGQIGTGNATSENVLVPTQVLDSSYQVVGVTTGRDTSCAWLKNGSALCWGSNSYGQLGIGNNTQMLTPAWVKDHQINPERRIVTMDAGGFQTCAQYDDGALSCWGKATTYYALGDNSVTSRNYPYTDVYQFGGSESPSHSINFVEGMPMQKSLNLLGWNQDVTISSTLPSGLTFNSTSQILYYDGTNFSQGSITLVLNDSYGIRNISIAYSVIKVQIKEGQIIDPWLDNASTNSITRNEQITMIDAFSDHTCITEALDEVKCWGAGAEGKLGLPSSGIGNVNQPKSVYESQYSNYSLITTGATHTCALDGDNELSCWGAKTYYKLGDTQASSYTSYPVTTVSNSEIYDQQLATVSAGGQHTCAIRIDATTWCWGYGNYGQIGDGNIYSGGTSQGARRVTFEQNLSAVSISAGYSSTCAILQDGSVWCWGYNDQGQLGIGNYTNQDIPYKVGLPIGRTAIALSSGYYHACAILDDNSINCWGKNDEGQIGAGGGADKPSPVGVIGITSIPIQISAGATSTCAVFENGGIKCWGDNTYGQLGIGSTTDSPSPQTLNSISHLSASQVSVGNNYACALFHDGAPRCWGLNSVSQLGIGTTGNRISPTLVSGYWNSTQGTHNFTQGVEVSIPVHVAGWGYSSSVVGVLPQGMNWNNSSNSLDLTKNLSTGSHSVSIQFTAGSHTTTMSTSFTIFERIDPWSDRIPSHAVGMAILDDVDAKIPMTIETGEEYTCFITSNEYNYCQGANNYRQLGDGTTSARTSPYKIYNIEEPLVGLSNGYRHSCGIKQDGEVVCWGYSNYGQVGAGSASASTYYANPTELTIEANGLEEVKGLMVSAGREHSCAIFDNLELYCWGFNNMGQLGIGSKTQQTRPALVNLPDNHRATDVSAGGEFTCSILENGSISCWGRNYYGQLGDGTTNDSSSPVYTLLPQGRTAVAISSGHQHSCAILDNQSLYCWGYEGSGRLGLGPLSWPYEVTEPTKVQLPQGAIPVQVSAGYQNTCAVMSNGSSYCWGYNSNGQVEGPVNDLPSSDVNSPIYVQMKEDHKIVSLSTSRYHACAITELAEIICWGSLSQKGISLNERSVADKIRFVNSVGTKKSVVPMGWGIENLSTSQLPNGMTFENNTLEISPYSNQSGNWNWQINSSLGMVQGSFEFQGLDIDRMPASSPAWAYNLAVREESSSVPMIQVDSGYDHSCGIMADGELRCWGDNSYGKLGDGSLTRRTRPTSTQLGDAEIVTQVSAGYYNTCVVLETGRVSCWGYGYYGQLGDGTTTDSTLPKEILMPWDKHSVMVSTGRNFACTLLDNGEIWCWGRNNYGQLGFGSTTASSSLPVQVDIPEGRFALSIDATYDSACAVLDDGSAMCWGNRYYGSLGSTTSASSTAVSVTSPEYVLTPEGHSVSIIAIGLYHGCATMTDQTLWCWGRNQYGEVGDGTTASSSLSGARSIPVQIDVQYFAPIVAMSAGDGFTCAHHDDATLTCWGINSRGQLGDGTNTNKNEPTPLTLELGTQATSITIGAEFSCATASDGGVQCWGENNGGQLGDSSYEQRSTAGQIDLSSPTLTTTLVLLEGELSRNEIFVSGWNYTFDITPPLPIGFTLDPNDGSLTADGNSTFGVSTHTISAIAGPYTASEEITIAVIRDTDGDGTPDTEDYDDDNDGHLDALDTCPLEAGTSAMGGYTGCPDSDGDGMADIADPFDDDPTQWKDTDGDGYGDEENGTDPDIWPFDPSQWFDSDGDDYGDNEFGTQGDSCPSEWGNSTQDRFGCIDTDGDRWSDEGDAFYLIPSQWVDRDGDGWGDNQTLGAERIDEFPSDGTQWNDTDGDGHGDNKYGSQGDHFADDPERWEDTDSDGVANQDDDFPFDASQQTDRDNDTYGDNPFGNRADAFPDDPNRWTDSDGDGVADEDDAFENDATQSEDRDNDTYGDNPRGNFPDAFPDDSTEWMDSDNDGVGNNADAKPFDPTQTSDRDLDGYGDDPLGNGADLFPDDSSQWADADGDGLGDNWGNTSWDASRLSHWPGEFVENANRSDFYPLDRDNDGYNDSIDILPDFYSSGDLDNDGVPDELDWKPADSREWADFDGDGLGDNEDPDDDNDGWADTDEIREGTDPFASGSTPIDSFEIVIPGTSVGLGAWDLIGIFGGVPLFSWVGFGFITRNDRCVKYEVMLKEARSREELEQVALKAEFSLMLRLLGPHQGIRLERLRAELDDLIEIGSITNNAGEVNYGLPDIDQTGLVEKSIPEIGTHSQLYSEPVNVEPTFVQPVQTEPLHIESAFEALTPVQTVIPGPPVTQIPPVAPVAPLPATSLTGVAGDDGYEWLQYEGSQYFRITNSASEWTIWQG